MLKDLSKLKGIDFSKKYISTDDIDLQDLENIIPKQQDRLAFDLPTYIDGKSTVEDLPNLNYKIAYAKCLGSINGVCYIFISLKADEMEQRRFTNHIINIAINSNHLEDLDDKWGEDIPIQKILNTFNVDQLKDVLYKYKLKLSGNKSDLINRLIENLTNDQLYYEFPIDITWDYRFRVTKEGIKYIEQFKHLDKVPFNFTFEEYLLLCDKNPQYSPKDIVFCLCYQDWLQLGERNLIKKYLLKIDEVNRYSKDDFIESFYTEPEYIIPLYEKMMSESVSGDIGYIEEAFDHYMNEVACENNEPTFHSLEIEANRCLFNYDYEGALEYYLEAEKICPIENYFEDRIEECKKQINHEY